MELLIFKLHHYTTLRPVPRIILLNTPPQTMRVYINSRLTLWRRKNASQQAFMIYIFFPAEPPFPRRQAPHVAPITAADEHGEQTHRESGYSSW